MTDSPGAKVVLHYSDQWSVFSRGDRYCERRLFWSHDRDQARRFASATTRWMRRGCPADGTRPLSMKVDGSIYRQRDFDDRCA